MLSMHDFCPILLLKRDIDSADIEASLLNLWRKCYLIKLEERAVIRRVHLSTGAIFSPIGLDLKLIYETTFRETLKLKRSGQDYSKRIFEGSSRVISVALGPLYIT